MVTYGLENSMKHLKMANINMESSQETISWTSFYHSGELKPVEAFQRKWGSIQII